MGVSDYTAAMNLFFIIVFFCGYALLMWCWKTKQLDSFLRRFSILLDTIAGLPGGLGLWVVSFLSITFIRDFLENYFESPSGLLTWSVHLEFTLFWISLYFALVILLRILTGEKILNVSKVVIFGWLVTFLPPIFDALFFWNSPFGMGYVAENLWGNYLTFYGMSAINTGATIGIRIEIVLAMIGGGLYVLVKTRSIVKAILASWGIHTIIYLHMALPAFWLVLSSYFHSPYVLKYPNDYSVLFIGGLTVLFPLYLYLVGKKELWNFVDNLITSARNMHIKLHTQSVVILARNIRPERLVHYVVLALLGIFIGIRYGKSLWLVLNVGQVIVLIGALTFAWLFIVAINDLFDVEVDKISNTDRPLIRKSISQDEYRVYGAIFFVLSLTLASLASYYALNFVFYFLVTYSFIYSSPPFRLKRFFLIPNILIGLCSLFAVLAGVSLVAGNSVFSIMPRNLAIYLFAIFTFASMIKDIKDIKGDSHDGIVTLPTLVGLQRAKQIMGLLIGLGFLSSVFIVKASFIPVAALVFAIVAYLVITKHGERYVFLLWFGYALLIFILLQPALMVFEK